MGIGIVLTIPNTVFAVASCDFNEVDENPITSSYASLTTKHTCNADDVMEINSNATMTVNPVVIKVGDSNNVSITNSGTISGGKKAINLKNGDNTILINEGIIQSDNQKVIHVLTNGNNVTITNSGTIEGTTPFDESFTQRFKKKLKPFSKRQLGGMGFTNYNIIVFGKSLRFQH